MKKELITFTCVGDVIIDRPDPMSGFQFVGPVFKNSDIAVVNMEQVLSDTGIPHPKQAISKGTRYIEPYVAYAFDYVSASTNHSMDWGAEGLFGTINTLNKAGIPFSGIGKNLAEARKPAILVRKGNKVGILNYCSVAYEECFATEKKPGVAPIEVWTVYENIDFAPAAPPLVHSMVKKVSKDMVVEDITALREQVDVLVVIYHWGQIMVPVDIPEYCIELAHASIDAGADIVIGHHPHILKGVEYYKGKAVFYSLGNCFVDFGESFDDERLIGGLNALYKPTPESFEDRKKTFILKAYIEDGKIDKVTFLPAHVNKDNNPELVNRDGLGDSVVKYMEKITAQAGLNAKYEWISDDEVLVSAYTEEELAKVIAKYNFLAKPDWEADR